MVTNKSSLESRQNALPRKLKEASLVPDGWLNVEAATSKLSAQCGKDVRKDLFKPYLEAAVEKLEGQHACKLSGKQGGWHFSSQAIKLAIKEFKKIPYAPQGWLAIYPAVQNLSSLVKRNVTQKAFQPYLDEAIRILGEQNYLPRARSSGALGSPPSPHYSPQVVAFATEAYRKIPYAPDSWHTLESAARKLSEDGDGFTTPITFKKYLDNAIQKIGTKHFLTMARSSKGAGPSSHYSPQAYRLAVKEFKNIPYVSEDWQSLEAAAKALSKEVSTNVAPVVYKPYLDAIIKKIGGQHRLLEARKKGRGHSSTAAFYSPEAIRQANEEYKKTPHAPTNWVTSYVASKQLSAELGVLVAQETFKPYIEMALRELGSRHFMPLARISGGGPPVPHYSPEAVKLGILKYKLVPRPPEGWLPLRGVAEQISRDTGIRTISQTIKQYVDLAVQALGSKHFLSEARQRLGFGRPTPHYSPKVTEFAKQLFLQERVERQKRNIEIEGVLNNPELQRELLTCIDLFGEQYSTDFIYQLKPEFNDIPREKVRGLLSRIIGDYRLTAGSLGYAELEFGAKHLKQLEQQQVFSTIVRHGCLDAILSARKAGFQDDGKVARKHMQVVRERLKKVMSPELNEILRDTEDFFCVRMKHYQKSPNMVGELRPGRPFPDIYQRINCGELDETKALLIADEMGVGKSASAIFAKEALGVKCAVVIVPANVQETWARYLSDEVADGQQRGYFKKGKQPNVLFLESEKDIERMKGGNFDYIVLSQEKLASKTGYVSALADVPFDMLIVDEVHKLKNTKGVRADALLSLSAQLYERDGYMALLSGTPVPNKVEDVAMLLKLLHPGDFAEMPNKELVAGIVQGQVATRSLLAPQMQMKSLAEHIEMPALDEETVDVELSELEALTYKSILQDDSYTASEKIAELRQLLLNPRLLEVKYPNSSEFVPSKAAATGKKLKKVFQEKKKVVMFVNDFVSDVMRGDDSIIPDLGLPSDVKVRYIHGTDTDRSEEVRAFQENDEKCLLVVSGRTADVGIDLSAGEHVVFYNDPWTLSEKRQQISRVYRPGLKKPLTVTTMETKGTIEEGIRRYLEIKQRAIEKLLRGGIVTDVEKDILLRGEKFKEEDLSKNPELAEFYFSAMDKISRVYFGALKYGGEKRVKELLATEHGPKYAEYYEQLTDYSYQANSNRVSATIIDDIAQKKGIKKPKILDMASGPEMLARHMPEGKHDLLSTDINPHHFENGGLVGKTKVASYRETGEPASSYDFANISLALDHEQLTPSRGVYDSAEVLHEMARVLKVGGVGVINQIYSLEFKNLAKFDELAKAFGLKVVRKYTGDAIHGTNYCSRVITFEKVRETPEKTDTFFSSLPNHVYDGLKMTKSTRKLRGQGRIISEFHLGSRKFTVPLNKRDQKLLKEEAQAIDAAGMLKKKHGSIEDITDEDLDKHGFGRRLQRTRYVLFKETNGKGMLVIR